MSLDRGVNTGLRASGKFINKGSNLRRGGDYL